MKRVVRDFDFKRRKEYRGKFANDMVCTSKNFLILLHTLHSNITTTCVHLIALMNELSYLTELRIHDHVLLTLSERDTESHNIYAN